MAATLNQIRESLWGLGVSEETLRGISTTNLSTFKRTLKQRGVTDDQINRATALAEWRPPKDASARQALGSLLQTMGIPQDQINQVIHRVVQNPDGTPRSYTPADLVRSASEILGAQVGTNLAIKINAPTAIPPGAPAWNPFRGDAPKGAAAPAAPAAPGPGAIPGRLAHPLLGTARPGAPPPPPAGGEIPAGVPTDRAGIINLQRLLNERGAGLAVDGQYGPKTRAAHQRYGKGVAPGAPTTLGAGITGETLGGPLAAAAGVGGVAPPPLSPTASDAEVEAYIRKNYGFSAWALDVPDVRAAIVDTARALGGQLVDEATIDSMLESRLLSTEWWKKNNANQRLKIQEKAEDPAAYISGVEASFRTLGVLAGQIGLTVPEGRMREIARQSYEFGWDQAGQRAALAAEFDYNPDTGAQAQSSIVAELRKRSSDYFLPLSEDTVDKWGKQIVAGTSTNEDFSAYAKEMAKGMFGHWANDLDAGRTMRQIADPFAEMAANELGITADAVNFDEGKWRKALEINPATGRPFTLSEWNRTIRTDTAYGWDYSTKAKTEAAEFTRKLLETFGAVG